MVIVRAAEGAPSSVANGGSIPCWRPGGRGAPANILNVQGAGRFSLKVHCLHANLLHHIWPLLENTVLKCSEPLPGRSARRRVGLCHRRPWHRSHRQVDEMTHRLNMSSPSPHTAKTRQRQCFLCLGSLWGWDDTVIRCGDVKGFSSRCCPIFRYNPTLSTNPSMRRQPWCLWRLLDVAIAGNMWAPAKTSDP